MCEGQTKMDKLANCFIGFVLFMVIVIILTTQNGCAIKNASSVISTSTNLYYHYENGEAINFVDQANLSDMELIQVLEALDQVDRSKKKLMVYKDQPSLLLKDLDTISFQYAKIKSSYLSVRNIVSNHWNEYTEEQKQTFKLFDKYASKLDEEFSEMVTASIALEYAYTSLKLVALI